MISDNLIVLNGKTVEDYDPKTGIQHLNNTVYRLRVDYDMFSEGQNIPDMLVQFCNDSNASQVQELIIGAFDFDGGSSAQTVTALIEAAPKLASLKALFLGDITYEENEISWINQCDVSGLLKAYPGLEYFGVRGGNSLSFGDAFQHQNLKQLVIQAGGLPPNVVTEIAGADLPQVEHLEIWMGSDNYGFGSTAEDFAPLFKGTKLPKLRYLGLRNSEIADEVAKAIAGTPILRQIEVLDLSMGTLGDEGAKALLASADVKNLKKLDLHYHYISDAVAQELSALRITVDLSEKQESDEDGDRYVQVAE